MVRLLFVSDQIPETLVRMVEFMNQQMRDAEVLAVEIRQFVSEEHRVLVPRVLGQTEEAKAKKITFPLTVQDEISFLANLSVERRALHETLLSLKETEGFRVKWTARGYTISFSIGKCSILLLQGNLPYGRFGEGCYSTFWSIRNGISGSTDLIMKYRERLLATGLFEKTKNQSEIRCKSHPELDENKRKELKKIFLDLASELRIMSSEATISE